MTAPTPVAPAAPRLVVAGANGYLGRFVVAHFSALGWHVIPLSRRPSGLPHELLWDGRTTAQHSAAPWASALDGAHALINLAGRTVNCRYNARNRAEILTSRTESTTALGLAIAAAKHPPTIWLNSSTATIYRHAEDRPMDEQTGEIGSGFSVDVALAWERALAAAPTPQTTKVALRTAMVMGPGAGGPFAAFYNVVMLRAGGRLHHGTQYVSWIHIDDFLAACEFLIARVNFPPLIPGSLTPINLAAPDPQPMDHFLAELRRAAGVRLGLPATKWMLEIGALLLGTETELLLKSRRVIPTWLLNQGFEFAHPHLSSALPNLVHRHRNRTA